MSQNFSLTKYKIVVSDFHLGKGRLNSDGTKNLLEDFDADREFIEFMDYYLSGPYERCYVELVLNGDFFNLLQIDYREQFTDHITESDAIHKTMKILYGHQELFSKMAQFAKTPNHEVIFILGNHDPGLLWEGVRMVLANHLGGKTSFYLEHYLDKGVYIEHGNHYYSDNRYDRKQVYLTKKLPEPILNLPFGSFLIIYYLNEIKKLRPYFDKIYPMRQFYRWAFIHDTYFAFKAILKFIGFFFWFHFKPNPARKLNLWQSFKIIQEAPIHPKLHKEAKRILFSQPDVNIVVFGHTHQHVHMKFAENKEYFNTGTWNERISLDLGSLGREQRYIYVHIEIKDRQNPKGFLREWKGKIREFIEFH